MGGCFFLANFRKKVDVTGVERNRLYRDICESAVKKKNTLKKKNARTFYAFYFVSCWKLGNRRRKDFSCSECWYLFNLIKNVLFSTYTTLRLRFLNLKM